MRRYLIPSLACTPQSALVDRELVPEGRIRRYQVQLILAAIIATESEQSLVLAQRGTTQGAPLATRRYRR